MMDSGCALGLGSLCWMKYIIWHKSSLGKKKKKKKKKKQQMYAANLA
jgi:hypothetical protein